jgi:hypothetical protein
MQMQDINSYRFGSGEEPTDEMLEQIMKEVAQDARESYERASKTLFEQMRKNIAKKKEMWAKMINQTANV